MKVLLDENFPLPLYHHLRASGEEIVFLTQDTEFETMPVDCRAAVIISRVRQSLPIQRRVEIWDKTIQGFAAHHPVGKLFDLLETGEIIPWIINDNP